MKPRITVVGSTNWDMSMKLASLPTPMETVTGGRCSFCLGGKGANQAVAAARAGGEVFFISCVGNDAVATDVKKELHACGIKLDGLISIADTETGKAMIFVDRNGENCIGVADGANACLQPELITTHVNKIKDADIVLLQMEIPVETVIKTAKIAKELRTPVILNPAPAGHFSDDLLAYVQVLTPNLKEMEQLAASSIQNEIEMKAAAYSIIEKGPEAIIITMGDEGAFVVTGSKSFKVSAFEAKVEDTTAAGDTFNGALAVAIASGSTVTESVNFAMAAAALSVEKSGAIPSIPDKNQINTFLSRQE